MAQRRSPGSRTTKSTRGKSKTVKAKTKRVKAKAASKKSAARKTVPRKNVKAAKTKRAATSKAAKATARRTAPTVQGRRQRRPKGGRPPAFDRTANIGVETRTEDLLPENPRGGQRQRPDDYVYEREAPESTNEIFTPGNLAPGQVGEAKPAPRRRGVSSRSAALSSETESLPSDGAAQGNRTAGGGFEEDDTFGRGSRDAEIAGQQRDGAGQGVSQDYGRAKAADGKVPE